MSEDTPIAESEPLTILGRDVRKIPCFKYSWIYGITTGIGAGLAAFMMTSRANIASHTSMGTMCLVTLSYFAVCRYQFEKEKIISRQIKGLMQDAILMEGTEYDETVKKIGELKEA